MPAHFRVRLSESTVCTVVYSSRCYRPWKEAAESRRRLSFRRNTRTAKEAASSRPCLGGPPSRCLAAVTQCCPYAVLDMHALPLLCALPNHSQAQPVQSTPPAHDPIASQLASVGWPTCSCQGAPTVSHIAQAARGCSLIDRDWQSWALSTDLQKQRRPSGEGECSRLGDLNHQRQRIFCRAMSNQCKAWQPTGYRGRALHTSAGCRLWKGKGSQQSVDPDLQATRH